MPDKQQPTIDPIDTQLHHNLTGWSGAFFICTIVVAAVVLAGWPVMQRLPALFFLLSGLSFFLLRKSPWPVAGYILALPVLLGAGYGYGAGHLPLFTVLGFVLSSGALLLIPSKSNKGQLAGQSLAVILFLLSLFSIPGHLFRVKEFYEVHNHPLFIPVPDAACFLFTSLGFLFARPGSGAIKDLTTNSSGGIHAQLLTVINDIEDYGIFMVDASGIILSWNKGAETIKGYIGAEVIGKPISIFYSAEDNEKNEPAQNLDIARIHGHYNSEGWRIRKDGSRFWADIVFTAVYEQGQLKGFLKITRDRTEFKRTQEQIIYQARFMEDTTDAVFSTDKDYAIQSWNKAAEKLYGYSAKEVIGLTVKEVARPIIPDDMRFSIRNELLTQGYWKGEVLHQSKNGTQLTLLISASATHDEQGEVDGYVLVCRDISDRKREEQRLQQFNLELEEQVQKKTTELFIVFERVSDGFMAFDKSGEITYLNKMAAELNKRKPEELIGRNFWQLFPTAIDNEFGENFHRAIDTQQNIHFEMFSPSLQLWIECYMYPSTDGLSLFFRDITEKRKAAEAISRSSEELRQLASHLQNIREEERATIAREIHDELGQQLTGLKMDLAWMAKKWDKPTDDPLSLKISGALGLLDNTIKTVRRIATELRPSILDDLGLIAAIEWQSQEFQQRSGITVAFQTSIGEFNFEPAMAIGLFRICQESLTNVARHSQASNVWIDLDYTDESLLLSIKDDGKGLGEKNAGEKKTLGLLGMKERAIMMGGRLAINNHPGKGLVLQVQIPIKESHFYKK